MPWARRTRIAVAFAAFGLVSHFVPSEPFLTPYLIDVKGFSEDQVPSPAGPPPQPAGASNARAGDGGRIATAWP